MNINTVVLQGTALFKATAPTCQEPTHRVDQILILHPTDLEQLILMKQKYDGNKPYHKSNIQTLLHNWVTVQ